MGWNGSDIASTSRAASKRGSSRTPSPHSNGVRNGLIALILIALIGGAAWWFLSTPMSQPPPPETEPVEEPAKPEPPPPPPPKVEQPAPKPEKEKTLKERFRERWGDGPMYPARLAMLSHAEKGVEIKSNIGSNAVWETRIARYPDNRLHQELYKYVHPGASCDTPDPFSDKEALELCAKPIKYEPDDTDEIILEKQAIAALAKEMKEYIEDGGHARDFLMKAMERQDHESEMMAEVRRNVRELCKSGDADLAQAALDKYNEYLRGRGLPPMKMDAHMKHYLKKNAQKLENIETENDYENE